MEAARRMHAARPSDEELAVLGLLREDIEPDPLEIWPENLPALGVFIAMRTQWRSGPSGPVGLDYNVLPIVMDWEGVDQALRSDIFAAIRSMERAALDEIYRDR